MFKKNHGDCQELEALLPQHDREVKYGTIWTSMWKSPESMADFYSNIAHTNSWERDYFTSNSSWHGSDSFAGACKLAKDGWKEGADKAETIRDRILAQNPLASRVVKYSVAGGNPNVPRAIAGNPMNMRVFDTAKSRKCPVITLLTDTCASSYVSSGYLLNRACVVAAIVDQIEAAGYSCEIIGFAHSRCADTSCLTTFLLKTASQPVDLARLSFGMGHPAMLRRLVFADWCHDRFNQGLGLHLGSVTSIEPNPKKGIYKLMSVQDNENVFSTEAKAATKGVDYLISELKSQGLKIFLDKV